MRGVSSILSLICNQCNKCNQLTVMCTTHGERRLISIRCQKECLESKLDGQTGPHSDNSANNKF